MRRSTTGKIGTLTIEMQIDKTAGFELGCLGKNICSLFKMPFTAEKFHPREKKGHARRQNG